MGGTRNYDALSDELLVDRLVHGDQLALESLYDRHGSLLYSVALRITGDSGGAGELLQDTFFQLWRKSSQFDSARGSLIGWLLTMTRHRAISRIRRDRGRIVRESSPGRCRDAGRGCGGRPLLELQIVTPARFSRTRRSA